jgi:hypothetical protein
MQKDGRQRVTEKDDVTAAPKDDCAVKWKGRAVAEQPGKAQELE